MPPRKQPQTLKVAALRAVTRDLTYQVRVVMSTSAQPHDARLGMVAETLSAVPERLRSDVVEAALRCADGFLGYRNNHPARRVLNKLLRALLPRTTRRLAVPVAQSFQLREALLQHIKNLTQLRELTLSESLHVHTSVDAAVQALPALGLLTVLRVPWLCTDAMLLAVAKHCPLLEVLDASESARVTDHGAGKLAAARSPALRVALLSGSKVTKRGYRELLAALPQLQRVGFVEGLGAVLRAVGAPVALADWDSDLPPEPAEASLCPRVKAVSLIDVFLVSPVEVAAAGANLVEGALPAGVERLKVSRFVGLRDHATLLRLQFSAALTHVDLMAHPVILPLVVQLGRECPDLRVLKLGMVSQSASAPLPAHPARDAPFRRLEELHLYMGAGPVFKYVLLYARALRRLSLSAGAVGIFTSGISSLSDATLRGVLEANPLAELESLSVLSPCSLTMASVYALLTHCPRLRALHDLAEWDVSEQQCAELREVAAANNWDLDLGPAPALA
ncbi:F-box/LRR-repeat protein 17 [Frankliniella fusca]|uniref:F-box/LRR-repeat protein 17 n=1 Tax=Frankliniella fusca TaxID=407009 RepID=A0AAE1LM53_9NEOP|nr:F-box/LRR-repeat protein 17 [Frankliniella fusca]